MLGVLVWVWVLGGVGRVRVFWDVIGVGVWVLGGFGGQVFVGISGWGCLSWPRFFFVWNSAGLMLAAMRLPLFFVVPSSHDGITAVKCSVYSTSRSALSFVVNRLYWPSFSERVSLSTGQCS
jgi:hypothetical protein